MAKLKAFCRFQKSSLKSCRNKCRSIITPFIGPGLLFELRINHLLWDTCFHIFWHECGHIHVIVFLLKSLTFLVFSWILSSDLVSFGRYEKLLYLLHLPSTLEYLLWKFPLFLWAEYIGSLKRQYVTPCLSASTFIFFLCSLLLSAPLLISQCDRPQHAVKQACFSSRMVLVSF